MSDICERIDNGPYARDFVDNTLRCADDWGPVDKNGQGSPCRMLKNNQKQKLTVIPLHRQFGGSTYMEGGQEKSLGDLLGNVYMAPLIDPYRPAEKNLSIQDATLLNESNGELAICRDQANAFMKVSLRDNADCGVEAQKQLLNCARNSVTDVCLSDTMGQNVKICQEISDKASCVGPTCKWAGKCTKGAYKTEASCLRQGGFWKDAEVQDEDGNLVVQGCIPAVAADTCYNVLLENQQCSEDTFLRQYVSDVRSGKLAERREKREKLRSRGCAINRDDNTNSNYIRLRTRAPHGITENGTKVLIKGVGNDGVRSVFVVDDFTLTYLRQHGDEEIPYAPRDARIYVPYESSAGMIGYTRGEDGRPAKKDPACVRRESRDQCENMLIAFKRKYTLLPHKCKQRAMVCKDFNNKKGKAIQKKPDECFFDDGSSTQEFEIVSCTRNSDCGHRRGPSECEDGTCVYKKQHQLPCGYKKVNAGLGPDPEHGVYHNTTAEVLQSPTLVKNDLCMAKAGSEALTMESTASVTACAEACAKHLNCNYFAFGGNDECLIQSMDTDDCATGWQDDATYDTYVLKMANNLVGCSRFGRTCCPESHVRGAANGEITCGVQEPTEDGAYRLMLGQKYNASGTWQYKMPPDDAEPEYCIPEQVEVLKQIATVRHNAQQSKNTFSDMQDKNSDISNAFESEKLFANELHTSCCDDKGDNCECPSITNFPVYFPGYHDEILRSQESDADSDKPKAMPVGIPFSIAGCDTWTNIESTLEANKLKRDTGARMGGYGVGQSNDDDEESPASLREACEHGWKKRNCEEFEVAEDLSDSGLKGKSDERLQLSACRSGIMLRSIDAPINFKRARMFQKAAQFERQRVIKSLTTECDPTAEVGSPTFCAAGGTGGSGNPQNACMGDGRGSNRCQQCTKDSECALQTGSDEYVCRPYIDVHNEIIYDNALDNNMFLKHGYHFKTCQRLDTHEQNLRRLDRMPFARNQRLAKIDMEIAEGKARQTTTVMMSVLAAAVLGVGIYLILRKLRIV